VAIDCYYYNNNNQEKRDFKRYFCACCMYVSTLFKGCFLAISFMNTSLLSLSHPRSSRLKEKNRDLSHVEVYKMLCLVSHIRTEVSTDDAMPSRIVFLVEFLFDEGSDILLNVEFLESLIGTIDSVLWHLFSHIGILNNCFSVCLSHLFLIGC